MQLVAMNRAVMPSFVMDIMKGTISSISTGAGMEATIHGVYWMQLLLTIVITIILSEPFLIFIHLHPKIIVILTWNYGIII